MGRFECIHTLKKFHASKTKTLNLSVKIEKNNHLISLIIDDLLVPDLFCYNSGDCFITKIQRCEKVEFIGSHRRATMEENVCENNDERIYSDSDTSENIVEKSMVVAF
jgi:hypothetical protein